MKTVDYYYRSSDISKYTYQKSFDYTLLDELCRNKLFPFEIDYIFDLLHTNNFLILYFYHIDTNNRVVRVLNLDLFSKNDFKNCFIDIKIPYIQFYYEDTPSIEQNLVYVFKRQDNTTYEKLCDVYRPKVDRYNHYKKIEVGFINKYGHKLIDIYIRTCANNKKINRSLIGASLILDK